MSMPPITTTYFMALTPCRATANG